MNKVDYLGLDVLSYGIIFSTLCAVIGTASLLVFKPHVLHPVKRFGLAMIASGLLMNLGTFDAASILFTQWTTIWARLGVAVLIVGYFLDTQLIAQLRRLNDEYPRYADRQASQLNSLREAAWKMNVQRRADEWNANEQEREDDRQRHFNKRV